MRKILMAAVALAAVSATPAMAASPQSATFGVEGTVDYSCGAISGSTLQFSTLNITATGNLGTNAPQTASQPTYCNGANSTVTVTKTAMTNPIPAAANFTSTIDFEAVVTADGTQIPADGVAHKVGAFSGNLVVTAQNLSAAAKPMAGSYSGSIAVTLTPAL